MRRMRSLPIALMTVAGLGLTANAQQSTTNEQFARRQYESGLTFLQNHRDAEALKDLQAVVDSFGSSSVADNALLEIAQYQIDVAHDVVATQAAIDRLLKDYPDTDSAPMAHVLSGRLAVMKGRTPADIDTAMASFERVPRLFPGSESVAAAGFYTGDTLRVLRRTEEALDRFRRVRVEYPRSVWAARAALSAGYCLVQQDRVPQALQEIQWVRQQFPGTPLATDALNLTTLIYRLYVRPPAQPSFSFSGRGIGEPRADYKDIIGIALQPDGRLMLGHKGGVVTFDAKGAVASTVPSSEPSAFFVDEQRRVVFARNGTLTTDRSHIITLSAPEGDGRERVLDEIAAVMVNHQGERLVADPKGRAVLRISPAGKYIAKFASVAATRLAMNGIEDVAMLEKTSKTIFISDRDGKAIGRILPRGTGYELDDPVDVAYDALDQLYVLDRGRSAVLVFGPKSRLVTTITMPNGSPGAFTRAAALTIDAAGRLFIFDERAKRVQVYQ